MLGSMTNRVGSLSIRVEDGITRMFDQACGNCEPCLKGYLLDCTHKEPVGCEVLRGHLDPDQMRDVVLAAAAFGSCEADAGQPVDVMSERPALRALVDYLHRNPRPDSDRSARIPAPKHGAPIVVSDRVTVELIAEVPQGSVLAHPLRDVDGELTAAAQARGIVLARPRAVQDLVNRTGDRKAIESLL